MGVDTTLLSVPHLHPGAVSLASQSGRVAWPHDSAGPDTWRSAFTWPRRHLHRGVPRRGLAAGTGDGGRCSGHAGETPRPRRPEGRPGATARRPHGRSPRHLGCLTAGWGSAVAPERPAPTPCCCAPIARSPSTPSSGWRGEAKYLLGRNKSPAPTSYQVWGDARGGAGGGLRLSAPGMDHLPAGNRRREPASRRGLMASLQPVPVGTARPGQGAPPGSEAPGLYPGAFKVPPNCWRPCLSRIPTGTQFHATALVAVRRTRRGRVAPSGPSRPAV